MSIAWMGYTLMYNPDVRVRPSKRYNPRRNYLPTDTVPAIREEMELAEVDLDELNEALEAFKEKFFGDDDEDDEE